MDRDSFGFYFFHLVGLASVAMAIAMGYWATFKAHDYKIYEDRIGGKFRDDDRYTVPWYIPKRLWRIALMAFAFFGTCYLLYGGTRQLTSWFPYSWRDEEGEWTAVSASFTCAMFAAGFAWAYVGKVQKRINDGESSQWRSQYREMVNSYILKLTQAKGLDAILFYHNMAYSLAERGGTKTQCQLVTNVTYNMEPFTGNDWPNLKKPEVKPEVYGLFQHIEDKVGTSKLINGDDLIKLIHDSPHGASAPQSACSYNNADPTTDQIRLEELILWANETDSLIAVQEFFRDRARWWPR